MLAHVAPAAQTKRACLLALDIRGFDDRPPFRDFGFLIRSERLRALLVGRRDVLPQFSEALLGRWIGQQGSNFGVELRNDLPRRTFRSEKRKPRGNIKSRES